MLFQPAGDGTFLRAAEADSFRGLVAAILDDPDYEGRDLEARLMDRLRMADDLVLLANVDGQRQLKVSDRDADQAINVASDERFIHSLDQLGLVSLDPTQTSPIS